MIILLILNEYFHIKISFSYVTIVEIISIRVVIPLGEERTP